MDEETKPEVSEGQRLLRHLRGEGRVIDTAHGPLQSQAEAAAQLGMRIQPGYSEQQVEEVARQRREAEAIATMTGRHSPERRALIDISLAATDPHLKEALKGADQLIVDAIDKIRVTALEALGVENPQ